MALGAHRQRHGNVMISLELLARRSVVTSRIVSKYNQCVRLAQYAAKYPDRWMLGRALANVPKALGSYLVTLRSEQKFKVESTFSQSALQIVKLAAWICEETGDSEGVVLAITGALTLTSSTDSNAYRWAGKVAQSLIDQKARGDALRLIERAAKRWKGEPVEGDYQGDTIWQAIQNMATALGIDVTDENDPLVRGLKIAAKDDSPERVLARCEHLLVTQGAIGPIARKIQLLFNTSRACSKVVHCTLHDFHVEGKDQDTAYGEIKRLHCDSCPDQKPELRTGNTRMRYKERSKLVIASLQPGWSEHHSSSGTPTRIRMDVRVSRRRAGGTPEFARRNCACCYAHEHVNCLGAPQAKSTSSLYQLTRVLLSCY
jgi:hypothetical protein